jgi:hypothetical protein
VDPPDLHTIQQAAYTACVFGFPGFIGLAIGVLAAWLVILLLKEEFDLDISAGAGPLLSMRRGSPLGYRLPWAPFRSPIRCKCSASSTVSRSADGVSRT